MLYAYGGFSLIKDLTNSVKNLATTTFSKFEDFSSSKDLKLYLIYFFKFLFYMLWVFCLHVSLCTLCIQCLQRPQEGFETLGTGVTDGCELPHGYWESNVSPLCKHPVLLTNKLSPQALKLIFIMIAIQVGSHSMHLCSYLLKCTVWKVVCRLLL